MSSILELVDNFSGRYTTKMKALRSPVEQAFDVNYFFYAHISTDRKLGVIATNADLVHHFFDEQMHLVWPFLIKTEEVKTGLYLYDSVQSKDFQTTMQHLEQKYQTKHSCLLTENDSTGCHIYGFAVPPARRGYESLFLNEKSLLKEFATYFQDEMEPVVTKMREEAIDLTSFDLMTAQSKYSIDLPEIYLDNSKKIDFLKKMNIHFQSLHFTKSEHTIIQMLLKNNSAREISDALFLSQRTIEHAIERLKIKLNSNSKSELVKRLIELNDFNLIEDCSND